MPRGRSITTLDPAVKRDRIESQSPRMTGASELKRYKESNDAVEQQRILDAAMMKFNIAQERLRNVITPGLPEITVKGERGEQIVPEKTEVFVRPAEPRLTVPVDIKGSFAKRGHPHTAKYGEFLLQSHFTPPNKEGYQLRAL